MLLVFAGINVASAALVVEYNFDGNGQDSSGNDEHLTLMNGAGYAASPFGQALSLDGIDDFATVNIGNYGLTNFTFEAWVNPTTWDANVHFISLYQDRYIVLGDYGGGNGPINTWASGLNPVDVAPIVANPTVNEWHHLAFTFDGTNQVVYVDGVAIKTAPTTGTLLDGFSVGLTIGARFTNATQFVSGMLDNVRIHDVALSVNQLGYYVDDQAEPEPAVPVPSMTVWGLALLILLVGFVGMRQRFI